MPDDTRPSRSKFFKVVKSLLSFDGSINRITSNPGGKNVSIIFAYATSLAFDKAMNTEGPNGKKGIDVFRDHEWLSSKMWLQEMGWGGEDGEITTHAIFCVKSLFNSFHQDEVIEIQGEYPELSYKLISELDYPSNEQIENARKSNKYFMHCIDDLINLLPETLATGRPVASRNRSTYLPLWEALLADPLSDVFREEMLFQTKENFPDLKSKEGSLKILEVATGTGSATIHLIRNLVEHYENVDITIYCYDEIANQLNRARERIISFDKKMKSKYTAKNITFNYQFKVKKFKDPITLDTDSLDLIITFQNLHYIKQGDRYSYFENLARMLNDKGLIVMAQTTSYSNLFPHPLTLAYLSVEGFQGYPTVDHMKELIEAFFKKYASSGIDAIWVISKPRFDI